MKINSRGRITLVATFTSARKMTTEFNKRKSAGGSNLKRSIINFTVENLYDE